MSWVQLFGDTWRTTGDVVEFKLTLWRDDSLCPRQVWSLELSHLMLRLAKGPTLSHAERMLDVEVQTLGFSMRDWREIAGRELRADAAWHEKHGCCHEYGRLLETSLGVREMDFTAPAPDGTDSVAIRNWWAVDFVLRTGALDGLEFPVELDAWLVPEEEFWRREPESAEELARFGSGEPNLRVMATGIFAEGWVYLPACADPESLGRRILREEVGLEKLHSAEIQPGKRHDTKTNAYVEEPKWPAIFHFRTESRQGRRTQAQPQ